LGCNSFTQKKAFPALNVLKFLHFFKTERSTTVGRWKETGDSAGGGVFRLGVSYLHFRRAFHCRYQISAFQRLDSARRSLFSFSAFYFAFSLRLNRPAVLRPRTTFFA